MDGGLMRTGYIVSKTNFAVRAGWIGTFAAVASILVLGTARADDILFDWRAYNPASTPVAGYIPAPFVNNATDLTALENQLKAMQVGKVAVKITEPLAPSMISSIFTNPNYKVNYAFYDLEGANAAQFTPQRNAVIGASPATRIGNWAMYPGSGDSSGVGAGPSLSAYLASGANMANEDLYPGSPYYKNPSSVGGTSSSPNIRSTLFTLPIKRATYVSANLPAGHLHVPYVTRFNNWGNSALDSDGNPSNGYQFNNPTGDQMLSRGDFKAMVAHYRLRGANGIHLLDGGVAGYTQAQFEQDAKDGWKIPAIDNIFNGANAKIATLDTVVRVDGVTKDFETAGVMFSGVYSLTQGKLALLVSNLSDGQHSVAFPAKIGGRTVAGTVSIAAGEHKLLEFTGAGTQWSLANQTVLFNTAAETDRSDVGVPEPVAMGSLSLFAVMILARRNRRA